MKLGEDQLDLDEIDLHILTLLQEHCKMPLAKIGEKVGLSAPAVIERIKKLEDSGIIRAYAALVDARKLGFDITAFIGVSISHPKAIARFEKEIDGFEDVLECHHVTGGYTLLLKVKTANTSALEALISRIRSVDGVERTETMVVLSTHTERTQVKLRSEPAAVQKRRRNGEKQAVNA
jgi:Lrp/AsnC family leucine-responsive transcriptional regulator